MSSFAAPSYHLIPTSLRRCNPSTNAVLSPVTLSVQCNLPSLPAAFSSPKNSIPSKSPPFTLNTASCILLHTGRPTIFGSNSIFNSGGGGRSGDSGGWGCGGEGGGFWRFFLPAAAAKDDEPQQEWDSHGLPANIVVRINQLSGFKKYKVKDILFLDRIRGSPVGTEDSFFKMVSLRPGGTYTKAQLQKELETLATCGMFEKVDMEAKTKPDGTISLTIGFVESTWKSANRFRCINVGLMPHSKPIEMDPDMTEKEKLEYYWSQGKDYRRRIHRSRPCLLPMSVQREILQMLRERGKVSARLLQRIRDRVQQWYHENGYASALVVNFGNLDTEEVVCEVVEGDITQLLVQFHDKLGNVREGNTQISSVIRRELRELYPGQVFNTEAVKHALRNISSLALFSDIDVIPRPDEKNEGGMIVKVKLKELEQKFAKVSSVCNYIPSPGEMFALASIHPGGTVSFEHHNINGLNRSLLGSVTTSNFFNPQRDIGSKLEYVHPYVDGVYDPRNRTFQASCFISRKLSPVFTSIHGNGIEVPPIWVDRAGVKANIIENLTHQSKFTYGLVMEKITTLDEGNHIVPNGLRVLQGGVIEVGPPTTLSDNGVDHRMFVQANLIRDNTKYVNGAIVGVRNVFQLDQGIVIGNESSFFNRQQISLTRFQALKQVEEGAGKSPPPLLVLHMRFGFCFGNLPSHDAFILGGPYSVRGCCKGEFGAAKNIIELAAELRIPVKRTHAYVFAEYGNDLGSSRYVDGNPTAAYGKMGRGSSCGVGIKLGRARGEYAFNLNSGASGIFVMFGERFDSRKILEEC